METLKENAGVVALVILAIMGLSLIFGGDKASFGTAAACSDGVTCFTSLAALTSFQADGASIFNAAATFNSTLAMATTSPSSLGNVVISGTGTTTLMLGSATAGKGTCLQMLSSSGGLVQIYVNGTTLTVQTGACK